MGGDLGPPAMIAGAAIAHCRRDDLGFLFFGDESAIRRELVRHDALGRVAEIVHCPDVIAATDKPSQAIRRAKTTSMGQAIAAVKEGRARAMVPGGNTGALMAMSKLALRTLPGIDRPALAALLPTLGENDLVMLDLGANTGSDARNLVQFAVMGAAYARVVLDVPEPRVKLLNIGTEELKGTDELKEAAAILRAADDLAMRFDGFTEGDKIALGDVDVVVTDGFSGNIALKTAEGTVRFVTGLLKRAFTSSLRSKIGFLISRPATELLKHHLDPNNHNGAVFLGLNGLVVKSHGNATDAGVANAIRVAARMVREDITDRITDDLGQIASARLNRQAAQ
jgi:phosphate acyltransferase